MPRTVVFLGPFLRQLTLRTAIADLLLPIGAQRVAPMMPDHGTRVEAERPAPRPQSPADVHVVPRGAEPRVEPADRLQAGLAERHVAPRNVLGLAVGEEDVDGSARGAAHALGDRPVPGRRDVWTAHARVRGAQKC